jgi:membrane-associated phospholipid phosphatase
VPDHSPAVRPVVRRRSDLAWFAGASLVLAGCSAVIDGNAVAAFEESVFRAANDVPGAIYPVLWPLMQFGTFISVPLVAIGALALKRIRLAIEASAAGVSTYFLAKVVKDLFPRDRPGAFLEEVQLHGIGTGGRGYPSGHAAVSASLAFVLWAYLPPRWRWVPVGAAAVVCFGRMFVGGHLPLDVVGGAALGIACGAVATFLGGVPDRNAARPDPAEAGSPGPGPAAGEAAG